MKVPESKLRRNFTLAAAGSLAAGAVTALGYYAGMHTSSLISDTALYTAAAAMYIASVGGFIALQKPLTQLQRENRLMPNAFSHTRRGFGFLTLFAAPILGLPVGAAIGNEIMPIIYHNQENARIAYIMGSAFGLATFSLWATTGRQFLSAFMAQDHERAVDEAQLDFDRRIGSITGRSVRHLPTTRNRFKPRKPTPDQ